jgi:hypothetical protein
LAQIVGRTFSASSKLKDSERAPDTRRNTFSGGIKGKAMIIRFPKEFRESPPPERDQLELWPDLPAPPVRDTRQTLLAEIEACFAQISAHVDAVRIAFALLDEAES